MGTTLTPQELAAMPVPKPITTSTSDVANQQTVSPLDLSESASSMRTSAYSWTGVSANIVSGDMTLNSAGTVASYLCMQLGDLNGATDWAETVLVHVF